MGQTNCGWCFKRYPVIAIFTLQALIGSLAAWRSPPHQAASADFPDCPGVVTVCACLAFNPLSVHRLHQFIKSRFLMADKLATKTPLNSARGRPLRERSAQICVNRCRRSSRKALRCGIGNRRFT